MNTNTHTPTTTPAMLAGQAVITRAVLAGDLLTAAEVMTMLYALTGEGMTSADATRWIGDTTATLTAMRDAIPAALKEGRAAARKARGGYRVIPKAQRG